MEFVYAFALVLSIILCIAKKKGLITFLDGTSISNNEESCEQKLADAAVFAVKGRRATMEDRFALIQVPIPHLVNAPVVRIFAVLDGHGGQVSRNLFFIRNFSKALFDPIWFFFRIGNLYFNPIIKP